MVALPHDNAEVRRPRIHAASLRELQSLPPALCYGETTVIVPFMPESPGATDRKSTVPGPTKSAKNRVVLPAGKSWLYVVWLFVYVNVCGMSSSFKMVMRVTTHDVMLIAFGENLEFEAAIETLTKLVMSYDGPAGPGGAFRFW